MFFRGLIALKGCTVDAGMPGSVIGADKLLKKIIEFLEGVDLFHIEAIEPGFFAGSPKSFNLGLRSAIPDFRVQEHRPDCPADQAELLVDIRRAVIRI